MLFQTLTRIFQHHQDEKPAKLLRPTRSFSDPRSMSKHQHHPSQRPRRYSAPTIHTKETKGRRSSKRTNLSNPLSALVRKAKRRNNNDWEAQTWIDVMPIQDITSNHREQPENWWATSPPLCAAA
ncbi:hypothetical protein EC973_002588 [Apophysomyces ossiformis]|uniref:Uncharacterized protein n=1 Tax=Apophysomyces ossiformis TaxID=679940 RepID=A0A8H7BGJ3_9FUNG|nr:hypothetical protein EC973_002588 [Apophysomyces ossiformis]